MLDVHIWCDCCKKEVKGQDLNEFACDLSLLEMRTVLTGTDLKTQKTQHKETKQICKGCYYKFLSPLFNEKK